MDWSLQASLITSEREWGSSDMSWNPLQWATLWRCHPSTLLLTCLWGKTSLFLEKCFQFCYFLLMSQRSIMNAYKPSKFNTRTEDTKISVRNPAFTQMEDIIPSLCPSRHQTHTLGDGWQDGDESDTHQLQRQQPTSWCLPEQSCQRSEHSIASRRSADIELGKTCCLQMQRRWSREPCQSSSGTKHGFYTCFIPSR